MLKKTSLFFSILFHPLFMPLSGIVILLFSGSYISLLPLEARKLIILLFATGTLLLPALMIPLTYLRKDILLQKQTERVLPLMLTLIFYTMTYVLFLKVPVYRFMHNFMLASLLSVFTALVINFRWKISLHMIGLGGMTAFLLIVTMTRQVNLYPWILVSIFVSGIVGTARLYLDSHSPAQIYAGYITGIIIMSVCLSLPKF